MSVPSRLVIGAAGPAARPLVYVIVSAAVPPVLTYTTDPALATVYSTLQAALAVRATTLGMPASVAVRNIRA